ncbi:hypothetical protein [Streptococcus sanguinis]|uniref:hypothetical protein n=1 Tax=Streptococcus sanguinis TaxID=1305 RepID=UPI000F66BE3B|nr:hypothetical protein [Streptococcus sanguinis]RSJ41231.1 hypothetical protein D8820_00300 [Streptococcus sanguinis]
MTKKIIALFTTMAGIILLAACSSTQEFKSLPKTLEGVGDYRMISNFTDPQKKLNLDTLEKEEVDQKTKDYLVKQIAKVQPLVIENAKDYSDDKNSLNLYYGYQRVLYIISDKYLEGTKEGEEYKKTALAEMIKLKEQYEKLTGEKVTNKN